MKKALARLTFPLRQRLGSTGRGEAPTPLSTDRLEADIRRLEAGWRQHIPKILEAISVSEHEVKSGDDIHARIDALREDLDRLSERVNLTHIAIEQRLARIESSTRQ